ncbi:MAG: DNA replication/repair protein RecF [Candidatus Baltobacteraceae bacterium]
MFLRRLGLSNFRNFAELDLEPAAGLNVFVGANAQGKSNLLEAVAMLGTGKSFRTSRDADTIRTGTETAIVRGQAVVRAGVVELACSIALADRGTRKTYTVNAGNVRYANYLGRVRVVTFVPADLELASGTPSARRAFLNNALAQMEPRYYHELARYRKALQQKNAVLRGAVAPDSELLAIYDRTLVDAGSQIMFARDRLVESLAASARDAHARFAPAEQLEIRYEPDVAYAAPTGEAMAAAFEERLQQRCDAERLRKSSLVGPHRDDLEMRLDGVSLATYGSQGQQRTAVLALKVAEYSVMRERSGEAPLLLLDDVLSELDDDRAAAFLAGIGEFRQAFVTATHVPAGLPPGARLLHVAGARVSEPAVC